MDFWDDKKVLVTGGAGFLGSHLIRNLSIERHVERSNIKIPRSSQCDLRIYHNCEKVIKDVDIVIHLAARVGGIEYNRTHPGSLFYDNATMGLNLMEAARIEGVHKFVGIGSVCAYPKDVQIPIIEEYLWMGYPEESNAAYGLAKKMLLVQSQAYREQYGFNSIYLSLANLYGPGDNFDPRESHVIPALIHNMSEAKEKNLDVTLWGTGKATRDFVYVKDAAEGILLATEKYDKPDPINIARGIEISIQKLSEIIKKKVGFEGNILWDTTKPDGQPRRLFDVSKAKKEFGFNATTSFEAGLEETIRWYFDHKPGD